MNGNLLESFSNIQEAYKTVRESSISNNQEGLLYNNQFISKEQLKLGTPLRQVFDALKYNNNNVREAIRRIKDHIDFMEDVATPEMMDGYQFELKILKSGKVKAITNYTEVPKKSSPIEKELSAQEWKLLKDYFGITTNPLHVGYIIPDGSCLNFSGSGHQRDLDHRSVNQIIERSPRKNTQYPEFIDVVLSGAIRVVQPHSFMIGKKPTEEQFDSLSDIIYGTKYEDDPITIELCKDGDFDDVISFDYDHRISPSKIKYDVKNFFDNGIYPDESTKEDYMNESFLSPLYFRETEPTEQSDTLEELKMFMNCQNTPRAIKVFLGYDIDNLLHWLRNKYNLKLIGSGSSRIVFSAPNGNVVKIAYNKNGLRQNKAESHNYKVKNSYGCFARIYWKSNNGLMIECEKCEPMKSYEDFERITGVGFLDYTGYLKFISNVEQGTTDVFSEDTIGINEYEAMKSEYERTNVILNNPRNRNKIQVQILKNLADYVIKHNSYNERFLTDLLIQNWGITERNGQKVVVLIDAGGTDSILDNYDGIESGY